MYKVIKKLSGFLFENRSVRQTIAKNTFWLSFGEITGRVLRTIVVVYAARILGPSEWGIFSYALSLAALFTAFSDLGLGAILIREGAKDEERRIKFFSTTFFIKLALATVTFLAVIWGAPRFTKLPASEVLILFIALLFVFDSLRGFGTAIFRATEKMEREAAVNIVTQAVILIAGLIAITQFLSAEALAAAYALGAGAGLLLTVYFIRTYLRGILSHFDKDLLRPIITAAWPFSLVAISGTIMINTDTIMIGWLRGTAEVGFYAAAQKPILLLYVIPSLIAGGFFPLLSRLAEKDNDRFRMVLEKGLKVVFFLALPLTIFFFLTAKEIIRLLYGVAYLPAIPALEVLSLTLLTTFPMSLITNSVFAYNRHRELIPFGFIGAIMNVVFNLLFIPIWGITGAAVSTLVTQIINNSLIWLKLKSINDFSIFPTLHKITLATLITGLALVLAVQMSLPFLITLTFAPLIYLLTLILIRENLLAQLKAMLED